MIYLFTFTQHNRCIKNTVLNWNAIWHWFEVFNFHLHLTRCLRTLLSLHNPVARAARALTGRYTVASKRAARRAKGYTGLAITRAARAAAKQLNKVAWGPQALLFGGKRRSGPRSPAKIRHLWWPRAARAKGSGQNKDPTHFLH